MVKQYLLTYSMKKNKLKTIIDWQNKFICMNEKHMQIQDNALIRKDEEITILTNACQELKAQLEWVQIALERSRNMVETLRLNSDSRSLREMAKDLFNMKFHLWGWWDLASEDRKWLYIEKVVEILSWKKFR